MANSRKQGRYWLLTINDSSEGTSWTRPDSLDGAPYAEANVCWLRGQKEIGADTGRPHWQLVVGFSKHKRLAAVKAVFGDRCHAELTRSSAAEDYVWKDDTAVAGTRFEYGAKVFNANSVTDWAKIRDLAKQGDICECLEIAPDATIRHYGALKAIGKDFMSKPASLDAVCGIWISGPPGVGKSHFARQHYGDYYAKMCNKWWDGYQKEDSVLIDDLDMSHKCLGHHLKIWADKYSFLAESKGHACHIRPGKIIVTSNYKPDQIWCEDAVLLEAIRRRFYFIHIPLRLG